MMVFILNRTLRERILPFRNNFQGLNTRNYIQKKDSGPAHGNAV